MARCHQCTQKYQQYVLEDGLVREEVQCDSKIDSNIIQGNIRTEPRNMYVVKNCCVRCQGFSDSEVEGARSSTFECFFFPPGHCETATLFQTSLVPFYPNFKCTKVHSTGAPIFEYFRVTKPCSSKGK